MKFFQMWKNNARKTLEYLQIKGFLAKVWELVENPETDDIIAWSEDGRSFRIHDLTRFCSKILPLYFKHNNLSSFIRQLNFYGFHKVTSPESNLLRSSEEDHVYMNTYFVRGQPELLENITRKKPGARKTEDNVTTAIDTPDKELLSRVLNDVNFLKKSQDTWDARLKSMKRENEALWRELAVFRQKHLKQEQIINKLIHFIVTIVQPSGRNVHLKRRYPLMINDSREVKNVNKKLNNTDINEGSPSGPTILELDLDPAEVLLDASEEVADSGSNIIPNLTSSDFINVVGDGSDKIILSPETLPTVVSPASIPTATSPSPNVSEHVVEEVTSPLSPEKWLDVNLNNDDDDINLLVNNNVGTSSLFDFTNKNNVGVVGKGKSLVKHVGGKKKNKKLQDKEQFSLNKSESTTQSDLSTSDLLLDFDNQLDTLTTVDDESQKLLLGLSQIKGGDKPHLGKGTISSDLLNLTRANFVGKKKVDNDPMLGSSLMPVVRQQSTSSCDPDGLSRYGCSRELGNHVENMQSDLDILKDILKGEGCSIDANTLLGLFNDDPTIYNLPPADSGDRGKENGSGSELISYNNTTNIMDLSDLLSISNQTTEWSPPASPDVANDYLLTPQPTPYPSDFSSPAKRKRK